MAIIQDLTSTRVTKKRLLEILGEIEKALEEPMATEAKAVAARKEGRGGTGFGMGMGFGGGQFGQSMPPRRCIEKRMASVAAQLAGNTKGFEPKPFGAGFGRPPGGGAGPAKRVP